MVPCDDVDVLDVDGAAVEVALLQPASKLAPTNKLMIMVECFMKETLSFYLLKVNFLYTSRVATTSRLQ